MRRKYSADVRDRAKIACQTIRGIERRPTDEILQRLIAIPEVDEGEALLYGLLAENQQMQLITGDKRAMAALCSARELAAIRTAVAGRVMCLESVLRLLAQRDGPASLMTKFAPVKDTNQTLQVLLTPAVCGDPAQFESAVDSYIADLKTSVGPDFLLEDR